MIRVLDARQLGVEAVVAALARPPATTPSEILRAVDAILADVRARGDAALLELTARFDGFTAATPTELVITPDEFEMAERQVAPDVRAALAYAAERIERYHAVGAPKSWRLTDEHGSVLGHREVEELRRRGDLGSRQKRGAVRAEPLRVHRARRCGRPSICVAEHRLLRATARVKRAIRDDARVAPVVDVDRIARRR